MINFIFQQYNKNFKAFNIYYYYNNLNIWDNSIKFNLII